VLLALVMASAGGFRLSQLDGLAPFIDEAADLLLSVDYQNWDVGSRLLHGKLLGYLWFKPVYLVAWDPLYAARLVCALTGVLVVWVVYRLLRTQVEYPAALAGTALMALLPITIFHDRMALFEGFVTLGIVAAVLLYLESGRERPLMLFLAGALLCAAVLTKGYAVLGVAVWLPVLRRRFAGSGGWKGLLSVLLGATASVLVAGVFLVSELSQGSGNLQAAFQAPGRFLAIDLGIGQRAALALEQLAQIFQYLWGYNGWAFVAVLLFAAVLPGRRWRFRLELVAACCLYGVVLSVALRFLFSRYLLVMLPALALLVALAIEDCLDRMGGRVRPVKSAWPALVLLLVLTGCLAGFLYRDTRIAAQSLEGILPDRDAYQYVWGAPSGFGLREIADELARLETEDQRKLVCLTRGMGTGTHGAATLPLILRHRPVRFVHLWMQSEDDFRIVRGLSRQARVVVFEDEPGFVDERMKSGLEADLRLLSEVKGRVGRPDYRLYEVVPRNR